MPACLPVSPTQSIIGARRQANRLSVCQHTLAPVWCGVQVAARVLDVLLQSDSDAMLPRLSLAVMEALSSKLLELDDFEELITYLKVRI